MIRRKEKKSYFWRTSHQLNIAGGILLIPILMLISLYLIEKNREIEGLERQVQKAYLISPLLDVMRAVAVHRSLLHLQLNQPPQIYSDQQPNRVVAANQQVQDTLYLLNQKLSGEESGALEHAHHVNQMWQELLELLQHRQSEDAEELFQQQNDLMEHLILVLAELGRDGSLYPELRSVLIKYIPVLAEDSWQLHSRTAAHMMQLERRRSGFPEEVFDLEGSEHTLLNLVTLTSRDFVELRNTLDRTFVDGLERDMVIPLMFDLVNTAQEIEDLIEWDVLGGDVQFDEAESFLNYSNRSIEALFGLFDEVRILYLQRLHTELGELISARNWLIIVLSVSMVLAIFLATTIVHHILSGIQQAVELIADLGQGNHDRPISPYQIHYNRSREVTMMLSSIERARQKLQAAAQQNRQAHQEIEGQKNFLKGLTNNMQNGVYALDQQGLVTFVNPAAEKMLGYRADELIGRNMHETIHTHLTDGDVIETVDCPVYKAIRNGERYSIEQDWFVCKDGSMIPVEFNAAPLIDQGEVQGSVAVFNNIALRLDMEAKLKASVIEAEKANRAKGDFLANMNHEIRTPMNAIIGMGHLALQREMDSKQRGYIEKMHGAALSLLGIINDILDFSKVEAGKLDIEEIPFRLSEVIMQQRQLLMERSNEKGINLHFEVDTAVPDGWIGDSGRIGQVLTNLTSNALKFTEQGEVVVRVEHQGEGGDDKQWLLFSVSDQGIGMSREQQKRLFQPFTQADGSISRKFGGTGLGLSISKQLVELMGGEISMESELGSGSTFRVRLPLQLDLSAEDGVKGIEEKPVQSEEIRLEGVRILLVEDNPVNQLVAADLLKLVGAEVDMMANGAEALDYLQQKAEAGSLPDVVLMDVQMPVMDGYQATQEIRRQARYDAMPVIAMTANAMARDQQAAREAGMDDYVPKPIDPDQLYRTVAGWITSEEEGDQQVAAPDEVQAPVIQPLQQYEWRYLDYDRGLRQSGGKESLFRKVLSSFYHNQAGAITGIQEALVRGEPSDAMRMAHSLKGTAGTIGALALQQQAALLEQQLQDKGNGEALLEEVAAALDPVIEEIGQVLQESAGKSMDQEGVLALNEITTQLYSLLELIDQYDTEALDLLEGLLPGVGERREPLQQVMHSLEQYDFDNARLRVVEWLEQAEEEVGEG